jgi:hypothetical protein
MRISKYGAVEPNWYHAIDDYRGFQFRYCADELYSGTVMIFVERQPNYELGEPMTYLIPEGARGYDHPPIIKVPDEGRPDSVRKAMRIAHAWADLTITYLNTGRWIVDQAREPFLLAD